MPKDSYIHERDSHMTITNEMITKTLEHPIYAKIVRECLDSEPPRAQDESPKEAERSFAERLEWLRASSNKLLAVMEVVTDEGETAK